MTWIFDTTAPRRSLAVVWILGGSLLVGVGVGLFLALATPSHGSKSTDGPEPEPAANAAAPDSRETTLKITTMPEGAEIVGPRDEVLGITPLTLRGTPEELAGIYTAWADGFEPLQRKVNLEQLGGEPIVLELENLEPVRCVVRTSPAGAVITDAGVEIGKTPTVVEVVPGGRRLIEVSLGERKVSLELKGFDDCAELIEFSVPQSASAAQAKVERDTATKRKRTRKKKDRDKRRGSDENSGTWRVRPELAP